MKKTIKKYSNRKYYDAEKSQYISLREMFDLTKNGAEITVLDHETGVDLTHVALKECVKKYSTVSAKTLRTLIANSSL